jgi:cell division protein FtsI (penicillin-binding protein 3)
MSRRPPKRTNKTHPKKGKIKRKPTSRPRKTRKHNSSSKQLWPLLKEWFDVSRSDNREDDTKVRVFAIQRIQKFTVLIGVAFFALICRAAFLMLIPNEELERHASIQFQETNIIHGRRGDIFDRNKELMATSVTLNEVIINPLQIPDDHISEVAELLAKHLNINKIKIEERIKAKKERKGQYLVAANRITPNEYKALKDELRQIYRDGDKEFRRSFKYALYSITSQQKHYRYYTGRTEGAPLLGGVKVQNHRGAGGLEYQYDSILRGGEFVTVKVRDAQNNDLTQINPSEVAPQAQDGQSLVLTIDRRIQHIVDKTISKTVKKTGAKYGYAVVVDIKTGEILASSTQPTVNINTKKAFSSWDKLKARSFIDSYEAGSVFKPLIAAAAMNEGLFSRNSLINCKGGAWRIHGMTISDEHPRKLISLNDVIKYSSNIGAAQLILALGKEKAIEYLRDYGFGIATGLEFPGEPRGVLRSADNVKSVELITMSYGYGLTSTLTQMVMAYASLGNEGKLMKPLLVKEILNTENEVIEKFEPKVLNQVVSPDVALVTLKIMQTVVDDGTAKNAQVRGYSVAGKTGTAKKAVAGGYSKTERIGSFVGLIPVNNPRLAIGISIDTPTIGSTYGGAVAAPAFAEIAHESMRILGVPVDPKLIEVEEEESIYDLPPPIPEIIWTEKGKVIIPDLTGLTLRDALSTLQVANLDITFNGSGRVIDQRPVAGSHLAPTQRIEMTLQ